MARAAKTDVVECPRCGYDVSGVMSLWKTECPVEGRCSECGYGFQWKHLLSPNLGVPKWFFETARRKKIRAAISTSVRTVAPWWFWRWVPLHAPFKVKRMVALVTSAALIAFAASVVSLAVCPVLQILNPSAPWSQWNRNPYFSMGHFLRNHAVSYVLRAGRWPLGVDDDLAPLFESVVAWNLLASALVGVGFLAVSHTLRMHRVRFMHLIRAGAYSVAFTCMGLGVWFAVVGVVLVCRLTALSRYSYGWRNAVGLESLWLLWPIAMVGWWWCVCANYLRIRHPLWVALLMTAMAYLTATAMLYPVIINPLTWYEISRW